MAIYAIGDVQGCFDSLQQLVDLLSFDPATDQLWFVGDLVNRGPQSLAVLRYVKSLGGAAELVLGNHDLHLIMQAEGYGRANKEDTLSEVLAAPDCNELLAWLRSKGLFHVGQDWAMVHAGLLPTWTIAQAKVLSDEVSAALTARNYRDFLAHMWGSEPARWCDDLKGWDRLRVVVNAMTRMRYVTEQGTMALREKGAKSPPGLGPAGCVPWFSFHGRASAMRDSAEHASGSDVLQGVNTRHRPVTQRIVCGHWSALGYHAEGNVIAIDTGCLWGGALTALRLDDRQAFSLPCPQRVAPSGWD